MYCSFRLFRVRLHDTIESSLRREIDHLRNANRAICEAVNEQGTTLKTSDNRLINSNDCHIATYLRDTDHQSTPHIDGTNEGYTKMSFNDIGYISNSNNHTTHHIQNKTDKASTSRCASSSNLVANLNLALSQTAHLFTTNANSNANAGNGNDTEDFLVFDLPSTPSTDWLADLTIPATKYELNALKRIQKSHSGVKRKNTC